MNIFSSLTFLYVIVVFFGWGTSVFTDKLAANSLGTKGTWVYLISFIPALLVLIFYYFWGYKLNGLNQTGILWLIVSTVLNMIALVAYFLLFTKTNASWASAITALYPIFTISLAVIFLHEKVTINQTIGIFLAMLAVLFLSI
jgi:bacterial/archaeal transporter family protein